MQGYVASGIEDALYWTEKQQAQGKNIYWALNIPGPKQSKKASKSDLRLFYGYHVDLDLPKHIRRDDIDADALIDEMIDVLQDSADVMGARPIVVFTGNGAQGIWLMPEPVKATPALLSEVETTNKRLKTYFSADGIKGDNTFDAPRILRVPGTVNYPTAKKRSLGCIPILSELICSRVNAFEPKAFRRLPDTEAVRVYENARRVDYTEYKYSENYKPYKYSDLARDRPELEISWTKTLNKNKSDRSNAVWAMLQDTIAWFCDKEGCAAEDFIDDTDILRNISEFFWDCPVPFHGHIEDHEFGRSQLGFELKRTVTTAAAKGVQATLKRQKSLERAEKAAVNATKPEDALAPDEARTDFVHYVRSMIDSKELTNCLYGSDGNTPTTRQLATESNIRDVCREAGILLDWDAMRDQLRVRIDEAAMGQKREKGEPARNWRVALSRALPDMRALAEESLLCDCFAQFGITSRRDLPELITSIAKENRFHPLEDYCRQEPWDGIDRIKQVADCLESTHEFRELYIRMFFRQAVATVKSFHAYKKTGDGLQIAGIPILVGPQFIGKTTFWRKLVPQGFLSKGRVLKLGQYGENDSMRECLSGVVCIVDEIGASLTRSEDDALKTFISATYDEFRVAFGRTPVSKARQTMFAGTANRLALRDETGSRRMWPMDVVSIDFEALAQIDLQQVYAQAWHEVMEERKQWWLTEEQDRIRAGYSEDHKAVSEEEAVFSAYMDNITQGHDYQWLTGSQICEVLGLRYHWSKWQNLEGLLHLRGLEFRVSVRTKRGRAKRVFGFPVLPEKYMLVINK